VRSDDLHGKQFSTHRPGYDKKQVAAFLEAAGIRLAAMESTDRPAGPPASGAIHAEWAEWADSTRFQPLPAGGGATRRRRSTRSGKRFAIRSSGSGNPCSHRMRPATSGSRLPGKAGYKLEEVDAFFDKAEQRLAAMRAEQWLAAMRPTDKGRRD
jgi:DivIVA domain-containing protein